MTGNVAENATYPRLAQGRWVSSPLEHLAVYAHTPGEPYVAVPKALLLAASRFRECSDRRVFTADEDGPTSPIEAICRRQDGHDKDGGPDHVRQHSNGYYSWDTVPVSEGN